MKKFIVTDIDDYLNRLTDEQKETLIKHCNKYNIKPIICAWYNDLEDFYSDWVDNIGYSKSEAKEKLIMSNNKGEFKRFKNGSIVRLVY